jgi:hypothetical protein
MRGVIVAAAMIVALMVMVKDGRALRKIGLTGSCTAVVAPAGESGDWERCVKGKLEGAPDLSRHGCTSAGMLDGAEYWRCPAQIGSAPGT